MDDRSHTGLNGYASSLIKFKARQLSRRSGFSRTDRDDIEQDLWTDLLERLPRYDPAQASLNTFVARVIEHKVVSLLRFHLAERRSHVREEFSLNDTVVDSDGHEIEQQTTLNESAIDTRARDDLQRDVADVLARLPDELRAAALELAFGTPNAARGNLGISRRAMTRAMDELRESFRDAGLDKYL